MGNKKVIVLFLFLLLFLVFDIALAAPAPIEYAPDLWFDSEEQYYPTNPLDFYYDESLNELPGQIAKQKYDALSFNEKINNFVVYYNIHETEKELIYQYWFFYVFNEFANDHYGDTESVFVFVDKNSERANRVIASAHNGSELKIVMANSELRNPKTKHSTILVEVGSHANWIDGNNDGLRNKRKDISNWLNAWAIWHRSEEDVKNGFKINHNEYKLRPVEEIKMEKKLIEKSPVLGFGKFQFMGKQRYVTKIGGYPTRAPWEKPIYYNPEEIRPITGELVLEKVKDAVASVVRVFRKQEEQKKKIVEDINALKEIVVDEIIIVDSDVGAHLRVRPKKGQTHRSAPTKEIPDINILNLKQKLLEIKEQAEDLELQIPNIETPETPEIPENNIPIETPAETSVEKINTYSYSPSPGPPDTTPPILTLNQSSPILTNATSTTLSGTVSESSTLYINFNNATSSLEIDNNWSYSVSLAENASTTINLSAKDSNENLSNNINLVIEVDTIPITFETNIIDMDGDFIVIWNTLDTQDNVNRDFAKVEFWLSINSSDAVLWQSFTLNDFGDIPPAIYSNNIYLVYLEYYGQLNDSYELEIRVYDEAGNINSATENIP